MKKLLLFFFLFLMGHGFVAFGQWPMSYTTSTVGGSTYDVCYHDGYLIAGCANTLRVYALDGVNEKPETILFEERLISHIDQLQVNGNFLYVCANHAGLYKYDITDPENPVYVTHYQPADLSESVYDVAFYGDSLLVAAKTKVLVLEDDGSSINYLSTYASYAEPGRVRGLDIKDNLLAYTVALTAFSLQDGVYLVDLETMTELDYFNDNASDPLEVYFGESTELLHVMGGQLPFTVFHGRYYALDYSTTSDLNLVFQDTIFGNWLAGGSIATPMSAFLLNDTIYISTQGGGPDGYTFPDPYTGQIYIYDGTDPGDIQYLNDVYAGLYHFDADINPDSRKMYVASEWYGVLTVDVNDIFNEIDHGKTWTGGWCHGSAKKQDRLIQANEGYGVRLYDVSDLSNPTLIEVDTTVGFCRAVAMDDDANYAYCFYLTGDRFRVYDANTLDLVSVSDVDPSVIFIGNFQNARYFDDYVVVMEEVSSSNEKITLVNVSDPLSPIVEQIRPVDELNDVFWLSNGNLLSCAEDSIIVFDITDMSIVTSYEASSGNTFRSCTESNDTLFVYQSGSDEGIVRIAYSPSGGSLSYVDQSTYSLTTNHRVLMASDDISLFITSSLDSLKALEKTPPYNELQVYDHGADFIFDHLWGVQDLYVEENYLFLNEYMGQTSIFELVYPVAELPTNGAMEITVYPNPSSGQLIVESLQNGQLSLYSLDGSKLFSEVISSGKTPFDLSDYPAGVYLVELVSDNDRYTTRLILR